MDLDVPAETIERILRESGFEGYHLEATLDCPSAWVGEELLLITSVRIANEENRGIG